MAIKIDQGQRDAMYQEVVLDLNGLTDLGTEFSDGNYDRAKELRQRFVLDRRLLDDLDWKPEPDADEFTLTMDGVDLAWVVSHLIAQTGAIIHTHVVEPIERTPHAERGRSRRESRSLDSLPGSRSLRRVETVHKFACWSASRNLSFGAEASRRGYSARARFWTFG